MFIKIIYTEDGHQDAWFARHNFGQRWKHLVMDHPRLQLTTAAASFASTWRRRLLRPHQLGQAQQGLDADLEMKS
jgi:hypothetical protein